MFWQQVRMVPLTRSEARMPQFLRDIENSRNFKYALFALKVAIENFVETGSQQAPSKFDIGPINTMITSNFVDGTRTRLSGQTTANLNRHWFLKATTPTAGAAGRTTIMPTSPTRSTPSSICPTNTRSAR